MPHKIEDINRARKPGFLKYMTLRPFYFEQLSGKKATKENILNYFKELQVSGLVVNPHPPKNGKKQPYQEEWV
ncbi:MAG: hypothetical protein JW902_12230 [Syntrophaceae bacterium]|nr:hypothetical protein [Syntrophaceae bacterium]